MVEVRIIMDKLIDFDVGNCKWWIKGVCIEVLEWEGDVCWVKVIIIKFEFNWVKVCFKLGFGMNFLIIECDMVGWFDV